MHHYRGAETCLVREYTALEALRDHRADEHADAAADSRDGLERADEDCLKCGENVCVVDADYYERADHEEHDHKRHDALCNRCNALESAEDYESAEQHERNADDERIYRNIAEHLSVEQRLYGECGSDVDDYLVDLSHASDTERGEDGENREENGEYPAEVFAAALSAETVLKVVHGTAGPLACLVAAAEVDAEYVLGVVGHHSEKSGEPHPKYRTGSAYADSGGNSGDITRADRCSECGAERLKGRYCALILGVTDNVFSKEASYRVLPQQTEVGELKEFCADGSHDADAEQDYDTYLYPHERIYYIVYRCDLVEKLFHTSSFYKISINKNCRCGNRDLQMVLQKDIPDFPHGCPAVRKDSFVLLPERFARCALPLRHPPSAGFSKVPSADSLRI